MNRIKRSKIWLIPKEELQNICSRCSSFRSVLKFLGYRINSGSMFLMLKDRVGLDKIDISHFYSKEKYVSKKVLLSELLVYGSLYDRKHLKRRLISEGLLKYRCSECGNVGTWNGKDLMLQLEHKNGDPLDNRIENLTLLCPNCHSQTKTYSGRNKKYI